MVPDSNLQHTLSALLDRPDALGIREIGHEVYVHPDRDPGCLLRSHDFLRPFTGQFHCALVLFDREGCGQEGCERDELEQRVASNLANSGWGDRAAAVVIDPELEAWVWSDSPHVARKLGWEADMRDLRQWLEQRDFWPQSAAKPSRPKEALERVLQETKRPRSSSLYRALGQRVSLRRCTDDSFANLKRILRGWFPPDSSSS